MKYGYVEFLFDGENIEGIYEYIERTELPNNIGIGFYNDYIYDQEDKKRETFYSYNKVRKEGYYDYPIDEETSKRIQLRNLNDFSKKTKLDKLFNYKKKLKYVENLFSYFNDFDISIDGECLKSFVLEEKSLKCSEYFILTIINTLKTYQYSNDVVFELMSINSDLIKEENASKLTKQFLSTVIDKIIYKQENKIKYDFLITEFQRYVTENKSEKEWQLFIFENYRFFFPEYLTIEREVELETIDSDKKYIDFILKNQSSVLLLEIKLAHSKVLSESKDRNNYYFVANVNKAILQAYRYFVSYKNEKFNDRKDINTKVMLLIGWGIESTNDEDKKTNDFELARSLFNQVEIVTYSELLNKIKNIRELIN